MRPHKMVSEYLVLMFFSQPVKQLSNCGCKLDCGRLASVCEERRAAQCLFKFVVLEAQHDAVLRVGGYPAVLHLLGRLEHKSFFAHSVMSRAESVIYSQNSLNSCSVISSNTSLCSSAKNGDVRLIYRSLPSSSINKKASSYSCEG